VRERKNFPKSPILIIALAIFFGPLGLPDFLLGRVKQGAIHLLISFGGVMLLFMPSLAIIFPLVTAGNWWWGVMESFIYAKNGLPDAEAKVTSSILEKKAITLNSLSMLFSIVAIVVVIYGIYLGTAYPHDGSVYYNMLGFLIAPSYMLSAGFAFSFITSTYAIVHKLNALSKQLRWQYLVSKILFAIHVAMAIVIVIQSNNPS